MKKKKLEEEKKKETEEAKKKAAEEEKKKEDLDPTVRESSARNTWTTGEIGSKDWRIRVRTPILINLNTPTVLERSRMNSKRKQKRMFGLKSRWLWVEEW